MKSLPIILLLVASSFSVYAQQGGSASWESSAFLHRNSFENNYPSIDLRLSNAQPAPKRYRKFMYLSLGLLAGSFAAKDYNKPLSVSLAGCGLASATAAFVINIKDNKKKKENP